MLDGRRAGRAGVLALSLCSCADLPTGDLNRCGNQVHEPDAGEDCDTDASALGPNAACSDSCRLICAGEAECPEFYACGGDGICRRPSGVWEPGEAFDADEAVAGATELAVVRSDGFAVDQLFRVGSTPTSSDAIAHCTLDSFPSGDAHQSDPFDCLTSAAVGKRLHLVADLDGDGRDDILSSSRPGLREANQSHRYELRLGGQPLDLPRAQPTFALPSTEGHLHRLRTFSGDRLLWRHGREVALLDNYDLAVQVSLPNRLPADAGDDAVSVLALQLTGASRPTPIVTDSLVVTAQSPGRVEIHTFPPGSDPQLRVVHMPGGLPPLGRATTVQIDNDGFADLLVVGSDVRLYRAYGRADGSFDAAPGNDVPGDQTFSLANEVAPLGAILDQPYGGLLATADLSGDGCLEVIDRARLVLPDGSECGAGSLNSVVLKDAQVADTDFNGLLDAVAYGAPFIGEDPVLHTYRYSQDGERAVDIVDVDALGAFRLGDFDGDLAPDLIYARTASGRPDWAEASYARSRPFMPFDDGINVAEFPAVDAFVPLEDLFSVFSRRDRPDGELLAVVRTSHGQQALARFAAGDPLLALNTWTRDDPGREQGFASFNPNAWAVGEFDGDPTRPELVALVAFDASHWLLGDRSLRPPVLAHLPLAESPIIDTFAATYSAELDDAAMSAYYAVMTTVGVSAARQGVVFALPSDADDATAGSDVYVGAFDGGAWTTSLVHHSEALIAGPPHGIDDALAVERVPAHAVTIDVGDDGLADAIVAPGGGAQPWLLLSAGTGAAVVRAFIQPRHDVADLIVDPTRADGVVWTGADGTYRARVDLSADRLGVDGGIDTLPLVDVQRLTEDGGGVVAAGNFDADGLLDVAVGDAAALRLYHAVPTLP